MMALLSLTRLVPVVPGMVSVWRRAISLPGITVVLCMT
jgi:hypothetical protein